MLLIPKTHNTLDTNKPNLHNALDTKHT